VHLNRISLIISFALFVLFSSLSTSFAADIDSSRTLRIASFNIKEISTAKLLDVDEQGRGKNEQLNAAAEIIRRINADVLIVQEMDQDYSGGSQGLGTNARRFLNAYINQGSIAIFYPYFFTDSCNTGVLSGLDLNHDGIIATPANSGTREYGEDCFGFGMFPGQYAMVIYSRFPIDSDSIRTFQKFLWKDLPGQHMPANYYSEQAIDILRLSSKSHWDVPVLIQNKRVHFLLSHPTPPVFDGKEDRNGRRNFDEIKFWLAYIAGNPAIYDDKGRAARLYRADNFIIAGDLNASPDNGVFYDGVYAIDQLLKYPLLTDTGSWLTSPGGAEGGHAGPPDFPERNTSRFSRGLTLRLDYLLVSDQVKVHDGGVFWPAAKEDPAGSVLAEKASDHRLVWLDIRLP